MKSFDGTTYQEWLDYHFKISYPEIVRTFIDNIDRDGSMKKVMVFWKAKRESE